MKEIQASKIAAIEMQFVDLKLNQWTLNGFQIINTPWIDLKILPHNQKREHKFSNKYYWIRTLDTKVKVFQIGPGNWTFRLCEDTFGHPLGLLGLMLPTLLILCNLNWFHGFHFPFDNKLFLLSWSIFVITSLEKTRIFSGVLILRVDIVWFFFSCLHWHRVFCIKIDTQKTSKILPNTRYITKKMSPQRGYFHYKKSEPCRGL